MKKRRILIGVIVWIILVSSVFAETVVDYTYTGLSMDQKRIQLVGTLVPDKDIKMIEYNHEISFPKNWQNSYAISKYTPLEQKLIDSFGYEKWNKLIVKNIINIEGAIYRFREYFDVPSSTSQNWKLEDKEILYTNMNHKRSVKIISDKAQEVTFKLYPIPSEYSSVEYGREILSYPNNDLPDKETRITLYDTTSEYHNVWWSVVENPLSLSETYSLLKENNQFDIKQPKKSSKMMIIKKIHK